MVINLKKALVYSAPFIVAASLISAAPIPPAQPDSVVNIPAAAGHPAANAPDNYCYNAAGTTVFVATDANKACIVMFPISVPVGHSIKQIAVIHDNNSNYPDPSIVAYLDAREFQAPYGYDVEFYWSSSTPVVAGTIETTRLMSQLGNTYYDTFTAAGDVIYNVAVQLNHGAIVHGIQVTYN